MASSTPAPTFSRRLVFGFYGDTPAKKHIRWSGKLLPGALLMGFGMFNVVEGIIDHHLLGIHHVNETVPRDRWIYWDVGFLIWGAAMLIGGWFLFKRGKEETRASAI
jgi:uncharacterized membrane protein